MPTFSFFEKKKLFMCIYVCLRETDRQESRRGCCVSWGWSYRCVWAAWCVFCGVSILIHWAISLAPFAPFLKYVFYFICAFGFHPCSSSEFAARTLPILSPWLLVTRKLVFALRGSVACSSLIIRKTWVFTDSIFRGSVIGFPYQSDLRQKAHPY